MKKAVKELRQGMKQAVHLIHLAKDDFCKRLKEYRVNRGWSLRKMSAKIGYSAMYISDIENGRRAPSERFLEKVEALPNIKS
jgi:ribosome-binding protein aMBF1 (putative translation factor)